jgi:hypothetical protein
MSIPKFETNEEIIRFVTQKMKEQGVQSLNGRICAYRGKDGAKSALGHLISDEDYSPRMEGLCPTHDLDHTDKYIRKLNKLINKTLVVDRYTVRVLRSLQHCHDSTDSKNFFKNFMNNMKLDEFLQDNYGDTISSLYQEMV